MGGKVGKYRRDTGAVQSEVLEQGRQHGECLVLAQSAESFEEHHHALSGAFIKSLDEAVCFKTHLFSHLGGFLEQLHDGTLQGGCRHLHLLTVSVESGGKSHDFGNSHFRGRAYAGHSLSELHDERLGGGAVLREVVDRGADFEHGIAHAIHLLHAEDIGKFGDCLRGALSEVDESHVDNRGRFHILLDRCDSVVAESTALLGEKVQLLAGKTSVHALEDLVEFFNLGGCHTGVLDGVRHRFLHVGV